MALAGDIREIFDSQCPKPTVPTKSESALVKQPKKLQVGNEGHTRGRSPVQQRSPSASYASASTLSDSRFSYSRSPSPYRRRRDLKGTTTISGYDSSKWDRAARQKAVKSGARSLRNYDDDVSDEQAQAALGVCPRNYRWYPLSLGYLCGGGHHLILHRHAEDVMNGLCPDGAPVEQVNGDYDVVDNVITPPPGRGDGNYSSDRDPLPKKSRGQWWNGDHYCDYRHEMWRYKR
ncbi:hypothetical protein LTR95_005015 [Oleoguttula sp. CCFEE 5521]